MKTEVTHYGELKYIYKTWGGNLIFVFEKGVLRSELNEVFVKQEEAAQFITNLFEIYNFDEMEKALNAGKEDH